MSNAIDETGWLDLIRSDIPQFNQAICQVPRAERGMFRGQDLAGLDLSQAHLRYCDLTGADLSRSRISGLELSRCRLERTILDKTQLDDDYWLPMINQIQILWRDPEEWNALRVDQQPIILESVDFRRANLGTADLSGVIFATSCFDGACLRHCNLDHASFLGASLRQVDCTDMKANLVNFEAAVLEESRFDGSELRYCQLQRAIAPRSSFVEAILFRNDLQGIQATESCFDGATLEKTLLFNAVFDGSSFRHTRWVDCSFINASMVGCVN